MPATYLTAQELRNRSTLTASAASSTLLRESKSAAGAFDVFLSHSFHDAEVIYGLRNLLQSDGLSVYVDWIEDPQLDRSRVSPATAERLRSRMRQCRTMIYATSRAAGQSRWMPWELGCFDGLRQSSSRIAILPIESSGTGTFIGQEYLGLYKTIKNVRTGYGFRLHAVRPSGQRAQLLKDFANATGSGFVDVY